MKRLLLVLALVLVALGVFHAPSASAKTAIPAQPCFGGESCDGIKPPPISTCTNNITVPLISQDLILNGITYGTLELHRSYGCFSFWGNVHAVKNFTVTAVGVWEDSADGSNRGALDSMPRNMVNGNNESTFMIGGESGACYHAAVAWSVNGANQGIWNTGFDCPM